MPGAKPKVALYWCASCGGCEEAVLDLGLALLDVLEQVELVFWPAALDFKFSDVEALSDGELAVALINGAIRTSEQEQAARLLRRKASLVMAVGACAVSGGIPALANLTSRRRILDRCYHDGPTVDNPAGTEPQPATVVAGRTVTLPELYPTVHKLSDVVSVDYYLPGCPPTAELLGQALQTILCGELPARGAVLAPDRALCGGCDRNASKPDEICIDAIRRVVELQLDPQLCFLAQGVICLGPATRDGCGRSCISGNMPCTGCFGPTDRCLDQGAKMIAALGSILAGDDEQAVARATAGLVDPAGTFYRYGLSASLAGQAREED